MDSLAIIAMLLVFIIREYTHYLHDSRKDKLISELTDKIKAKDFTEYKEQTTPTPLFEPVSKSDEDLWIEEIERNRQ